MQHISIPRFSPLVHHGYAGVIKKTAEDLSFPTFIGKLAQAIETSPDKPLTEGTSEHEVREAMKSNPRGVSFFRILSGELKRYVILTARSPSDLEAQIEKYLSRGYALHGGNNVVQKEVHIQNAGLLHQVRNEYSQAMYIDVAHALMEWNQNGSH